MPYRTDTFRIAMSGPVEPFRKMTGPLIEKGANSTAPRNRPRSSSKT